MTDELVDECLSLLCTVMVKSRQRDFDQAKKALGVALVLRQKAAPQYQDDLHVAWLYAMIFLQAKQNPAIVTPAARDEARKLLHASTACADVELYQSLMLELLMELGENRAATPFGERA